MSEKRSRLRWMTQNPTVSVTVFDNWHHRVSASIAPAGCHAWDPSGELTGKGARS